MDLFASLCLPPDQAENGTSGHRMEQCGKSTDLIGTKDKLTGSWAQDSGLEKYIYIFFLIRGGKVLTVR